MMTESTEIAAFRAFLVTLPLRRPIPVGAATWSTRPVVLIRGEDSNGRVAWGEASPLDGYGPDRLDDVLKALSMPGWQNRAMPPSLACAVGAIRMGLRASNDAEPAPASKVPTLTPAVLDPEGDLTNASHLKVKVGRDSVATDLERIRAISLKHPAVRIRLDGNGLMTRDHARRLVDAIGELGTRIDYFEEPWEGCFGNDIRGALPVPVAIDESLDGDNWHQADVCVIKPSLMGDPMTTLDLASRIQATGRRVTVSSAFESRFGMTMITRMAAWIGDAAPGLGTYAYMADDWGGRSDVWDAARIQVANLPPVTPSVGVNRVPFVAPSGLRVEEVPA